MTFLNWSFKSLTVVLAVSVSAPAFAGLNFNFPTESIKKSIQWLNENGDPAAKEVQEKAPSSSKDLTKKFVSLWRENIQVFASPRVIDPAYSNNIKISHGNFEESFLPKSLQNWKSQQTYPYRYYEQHQTPAPEDSKVSAPTAFFRRIISTPAFMNEMCSPTLINLADWVYQWSALVAATGGRDASGEWRIDTHNKIREVTDFLQILSTTWTDQKPQELDKGDIRSFLFRRYLDGGPEFTKATLNCINKAVERFENSTLLESDKKYTELFHNEFHFAWTSSFPDSTKISTRSFSYETLARILRLYPSPLSLTQPLAVGNSHENQIVALTTWMSYLDPNSIYRLLTTDEAKKLGLPTRCTLTKADNGIDPVEFSDEWCDFEQFDFVIVHQQAR